MALSFPIGTQMCNILNHFPQSEIGYMCKTAFRPFRECGYNNLKAGFPLSCWSFPVLSPLPQKPYLSGVPLNTRLLSLAPQVLSNLPPLARTLVEVELCAWGGHQPTPPHPQVIPSFSKCWWLKTRPLHPHSCPIPNHWDCYPPWKFSAATCLNAMGSVIPLCHQQGDPIPSC